DLLKRVEKTISNGQRVLITTLTKRMAEELSSYMESKGFKVAYLHSDIETLDRSDILNDLRLGNYDVLVGINLLREGLDLPEVSLVVILDADKEGFLRSDKSLIQTMGRAARHSAGKVILYADKMTGSMQRAIDEVERRRKIQLAYNKKHNVTPKSIIKPLRKDIIERDKKTKKEKALETMLSQKTLVSDAIKMDKLEFKTLPKGEKKKFLTALKAEMEDLAHSLEFEKAAIIRDKLKEFKRLTKN
ncbi:MAG TPA: excinuclease ABC subunit B, partial [candidate division WWE3 bacterium]|nr:excinuclease ABC subunit B [candidate division WWE3 bacterium]